MPETQPQNVFSYRTYISKMDKGQISGYNHVFGKRTENIALKNNEKIRLERNFSNNRIGG
jgi:hypothetical protein